MTMTSKSKFMQALLERQPNTRKRQWIFVPYDQLNDGIGPLAKEDPSSLGIVLVENRWKARQRPYHKQKLALILANMRHFALEQAARGIAVRYLAGDAPYAQLLESHARELGGLRIQRPAERELRADLAPLLREGLLTELPNEAWLTSADDFRTSQTGRHWRMDAFYRHARKTSGILMQDGKPLGGQFSYDPENRLAWPGSPPAAVPPLFVPDEITEEVATLIERDFSAHPGRLNLSALPATLHDAEAVWAWAKRDCLPMFGPFEDAMSERSRNLFHTRLSQLLNLSRLLPRRVVTEAAELPIPLASKEGFVRQILGWREFMHHVHEQTDGFRSFPPSPARPHGAKRHASPSELGSDQPLSPAFWGKPSGLHCLDTVVQEVWEDAYGHHITRLMVLSSIATLLDISPRELTDWFWIAYADAYDWVVEPNVLGMGTFALGDLFTTKPYVSGAAYIHRMSDYCEGCAFNPKKDCPLTPLYWAFLERHKAKLGNNPRLAMPYRSLAKRSPAQRKADESVFLTVQKVLLGGKALAPSSPLSLLPASEDASSSRVKMKTRRRRSGAPVHE